MPSERWSRLEQVFGEAAARPLAMRAEFIARTCGADIETRDEVTSLLTAATQSGDFLCEPALDVFARQIARAGWGVRPGDQIASYTVERRLGAGGMGEVWRARDERLGRDVAIKLLLPHLSNAAERTRLFQQEARAAGALNHTNVLTVYDVGEHAGAPFLVTECLEGEALRVRLGAGRLPIDAALDIGVQVARGLAAAHARGIVHRDLKPENVFLGRDGRVKILDFGLATLHEPSPAALTEERFPQARRGFIAGTAGYMAPEQVRGDDVDHRADIFGFGALLYEMVTGSKPFEADSTFATLSAVLTTDPPGLSEANSEVPPALFTIVCRCLAKSPDDRFATIADVASELEGVVRSRNLPPPPGLLALLRRPIVIVIGLIALVATVAVGWQWRVVAARARWARTVAAPEVLRRANEGDYEGAFHLAGQALEVLPDDPYLRQLWLDTSVPASITTNPPGADVALAPYGTFTADWHFIGRTPLEGVRMPRNQIRIRISKAGFAPIEASGSPPVFRFRLDPPDRVPPGMVRVVGGRDPMQFGRIGELDDFWIDRFEVTNRQFKEFVDAGGYRRLEYWRQPFIERGRSVSWEQAVARFHDATGQPGPATWRSGTYPQGEDDFPVGGVSWYEAAAYAAFSGKSLPTLYHWYLATRLGRFADILTVSNFGETGPTRVGSRPGLGPFGTYDMAGNVKEWCWNESDGGRLLLGAAWNEPRYMFGPADARQPFARDPAYGFRLVKYDRPLPAEVSAAVQTAGLRRDPRKETPVGDEIFEVFRRQYAYDHSALNDVIERTDEMELWRKQIVAYDSAYDQERVRAHLFLPKHAAPPYQTVVLFPTPDAFRLRSSRDLSLHSLEFIIRSGRAVLYPVFKGSFERGPRLDRGPNVEREMYIAWSRDLGRAIDYAETRADIDRTRLAFYGVSIGGDAGVILTALESRFKASVLQGTGVWGYWPAEIDQLNYAPRVRVPTLMLNGRYDFAIPVDTAQRPLFALLGTPAEHKRHTVLETGHTIPIQDVAREVLHWLDRYLGPVAASSAAPARIPGTAEAR